MAIRRYYYTLAEMQQNTILGQEIDAGYAGRNNTTLLNILAGWMTLSNIMVADSETEAKKVWQEYIWPRCWNSTINFIDKEYFYELPTDPDSTEIGKAWKSIVGAIYTWWMDSKAHYIPLIKMYQAQANSLMKQVESSSLSKYNDTPQDGGNFSDDNHTTNSTRTVNSTDAGTPIQRLEEIRQLINTIYLDWAKEFGRFIIEE